MTHHTHAAPAERPLSVLDAIFVRRSVRAYTPQQPDKDTIRALLDAAVQAPTAMHAERWAFVVVQDRSALKRYSDRAKGSWVHATDQYRQLHPTERSRPESVFALQMADPTFNIFYNAGTLVVICAKPGPFAAADCWMAAENLMLAACALGLGTCCIGSAVPVLNAEDIKTELAIPLDYEAIVPIIVGVPAQPPSPSIRTEPKVLCWR